MTVTQLVILGTLDSLEAASGYAITQELERKQISRWADIKMSAIYQGLKQLEKIGCIVAVEATRTGRFPQKTLYALTDAGRARFDELQREAFRGLYPRFYGFKLALKFNVRCTPAAVRGFAEEAIALIDAQLAAMDSYLATLDPTSAQYATDDFFIQHDRLVFNAEKAWIAVVIERLDQGLLTFPV